MAMVLAERYGSEVDHQARRENIKAALSSDIFFDQKRLMKLAAVPGQTVTTGYAPLALAAEEDPADSFTSNLVIQERRCLAFPPPYSLSAQGAEEPRSAEVDQGARPRRPLSQGLGDNTENIPLRYACIDLSNIRGRTI